MGNILSEYLIHVLTFCKGLRLPFTEARIVVWLAQSTFDDCILSEECNGAEQALEIFRRKITQLLEDKEKKNIFTPILPSFAKHITQTVIRNFNAYRLVFTEERKEATQITTVSVNTPIPSRPLSAARE